MERKQLKDLVEALGITVTCTTREKTPAELNDDWKRDARAFTCTLAFGDKLMQTPFYQGRAHTQNPSAADVLYSLMVDASCGEESYLDYLSEFGLDDSPKQRALHKHCARTAKQLRTFLGDHFDEVRNAEH